jgi:hypothetical protein
VQQLHGYLLLATIEKPSGMHIRRRDAQTVELGDLICSLPITQQIP